MQDTIASSASLIIEVFKSFRPKLLESYANIQTATKPDNSPVTELDIAVESATKQALATKFPELGFKGEESGSATNNSSYWIIDPIDGTMNFVRGLPGCTNMAAFVQNNETLYAIIYDFLGDIVYAASKGSGAYRNGTKISTRRSGAPFYATGTTTEVAQIQSAINDIHFLNFWAAGYEAILLATGPIDGNFSFGQPKEHDCRAPILLCQEAGAELIPLTKRPVFNGSIVNPYFIGTPILSPLVQAQLPKILP